MNEVTHFWLPLGHGFGHVGYSVLLCCEHIVARLVGVMFYYN